MKKFFTYSRYLFDYLKHGDFISVLSAIKYVLNKTSHSSDRIIKTSSGTFFCRKKTNDFQFANFYYEWGVKKFLLEQKNDYNIFIDGGACIGSYSVLLSGAGLRCIAFEPMKNNFDVLLKNLELNNLKSKVDCFQLGLGATNFPTKFIFNPINTGASRIIGIDEAGDSDAEIRTFDSIYPSLNLKKDDRILIKLDVEGMEPAALAGAENFIREFPNLTFVMEDKHSGEDSIKDTLNKFASFDYGIVDEFNIYAKKSERD
ncbi:MAG: FkbM family methyltransferase [Bacteroidales bacterium]